MASLAAIIGGIAKWVLTRIDKYTDKLSARLDKVDEHLGNQDVKIARIEGRLQVKGDVHK